MYRLYTFRLFVFAREFTRKSLFFNGIFIVKFYGITAQLVTKIYV